MEYQSIYYMTELVRLHSYIGIPPARTGRKLVHAEQSVGINHIAPVFFDDPISAAARGARCRAVDEVTSVRLRLWGRAARPIGGRSSMT